MGIPTYVATSRIYIDGYEEGAVFTHYDLARMDVPDFCTFDIDTIKENLKKGKIIVTNLRVTSDNRLVEKNVSIAKGKEIINDMLEYAKMIIKHKITDIEYDTKANKKERIRKVNNISFECNENKLEKKSDYKLEIIFKAKLDVNVYTVFIRLGRDNLFSFSDNTGTCVGEFMDVRVKDISRFINYGVYKIITL